MSNSKRPSHLATFTNESMPLFKRYYLDLSTCLDFCEQLDLDFAYVGELKIWQVIKRYFQVVPSAYEVLFESDDLNFLSEELEKMYRAKNQGYDR